jgi:hypothetical protein
MNNEMELFRQEVQAMQRRLNSYFEKPDDSKARSIQDGFRNLENELQTGKTGDSIQNRLKDIERQLKPAFNDNVMNYNHFTELENWTRNHLNNYQ